MLNNLLQIQLKLLEKKAIQNTAEADDLIGIKVPKTITKNSPQNNSETDLQTEKKIKRNIKKNIYIYIYFQKKGSRLFMI